MSGNEPVSTDVIETHTVRCLRQSGYQYSPIRECFSCMVHDNEYGWQIVSDSVVIIEEVRRPFYYPIFRVIGGHCSASNRIKELQTN